MGFLARWQERGRRARRLAHADALLSEGDRKAALAELEEVLAGHSDDHQTRRRIVELHADLGHVDDVVTHMTALLNWDLRTFDLLRSATLDALRRSPAFESLYRIAVDGLVAKIADDSSDTHSRFRLAEAYEALDEAEAADGVYSDLARHDDEEVRTRSLLGQARLAGGLGDASRAADYLRDLVELSPSALDALEGDAAFDTVRSSPELAEVQMHALALRAEELREALESDPMNVAPHRTLIELYAAHGHTAEAVTAGREAVEHFPDDLGLLELLADALFDAEDLEAAMSVYHDLLRATPRHSWALYRTGVVHERREETGAARECYVEALETTREDAASVFLVARGLSRIDEPELAIDALERAVQLALQFGQLLPDRLLERIEAEPDLSSLRDVPRYRTAVDVLRDALPDDGDSED